MEKMTMEDCKKSSIEDIERCEHYILVTRCGERETLTHGSDMEGMVEVKVMSADTDFIIDSAVGLIALILEYFEKIGENSLKAVLIHDLVELLKDNAGEMEFKA